MLNRRTVFLLESGIANFPSDWKDWPNPAITWFFKRGYHAQSLFYFTTALTVWMRRRRRAAGFAKLVTGYFGSEIHAAGHSNGSHVILDGLRLADWPVIETLHLLCGACDADFERTGLNWALRHGRIKLVFVYVAGRDSAMKLEDIIFGKMLFGISGRDKPFGLQGPLRVAADVSKRVIVKSTGRWKLFDHSACWQPVNFNATLEEILVNASLASSV